MISTNGQKHFSFITAQNQRSSGGGQEVPCEGKGGGGDEKAGEGVAGTLPAHPGQVREEPEGTAEPVCQVVQEKVLRL